MLNRDLTLKLGLIAGTAVLALVLMICHGMRFDILSAWKTAATLLLLLPFALIFEARRIHTFANLLTGFLCMVGFNLFLAILTYAGTPLNAPSADGWLMRADAALGIHLPSVVEWTRAHAEIRWLLDKAYASVLPSTLIAIIVLGFDRDVRRLREFVLHFMIAGLVTTLVYFMCPAEGPFAAYGYELRTDQARFLTHFHALRAGQFSVVSMSNLEGLITFPSFHTTWALLLAYAFRHYRLLFAPMLLLNLAVVVSTMTTGWHYGTDVIGGIVTAGIAILTAKAAAGVLTDPADDRETVPSQAGLPTPKSAQPAESAG